MDYSEHRRAKESSKHEKEITILFDSNENKQQMLM